MTERLCALGAKDDGLVSRHLDNDEDAAPVKIVFHGVKNSSKKTVFIDLA